MQRRGLFLCVLGCLFGIQQAFCVQPPALKPNISIEQPVAGFAIQDAFPSVTFNQPIGIAVPPGETNRLFVVEKPGVIAVITNLAAPTRSVFLDLTATTDSSIEGGLLGLAFHPGFATNGYFFIYRTAQVNGYFDQLSRFKVSSDSPNLADPASETVFISQGDLTATHNGGGLEFGPDGYLYLSIGDETPLPEDDPENGQAIDRGLFGCVIRIDVDKRPGNLPPNSHHGISNNYSIPADNPWIGATSFMGKPVNPDLVRTELYAIGLRNPWRITFDPLTHKLIVADVGGGVAEEIDDVTKGGNYGWPFYEATYPGSISPPPDLEVQFPVHYYQHGRGLHAGTVIIGGVVSRDGSIPLLEGSYLFGDGRSGNIWALPVDKFGQEGVTPTWIASEPGNVAYGRDPRNGDVLLANYDLGTIRRLIYVDPSAQHIPQKLSDAGLFADLQTLSPVAELTPYSINAPFWSDNAIKKRWFGLVDPSQKITFAAETNWTFPSGSVWVKHFDLEMVKGDSSTTRRVETRVMIKNDSGMHGFTYRWNDAQSDAALVAPEGDEWPLAIMDNGQIRTQVWQFPARANCNTCHREVAGYALGFNTAQLNRTNSSGVNQLSLLNSLGYLDHDPGAPDQLRQLANPRDTSQPLEHRIKSYFSANCSQCHQPGGPWGTTWDARLTTPLAEENIINTLPGGPLADTSRIVAPNSLTNSMIYMRMSDPGPLRMPPLGSTVLDDDSRAMVADWITTMPEAGWINAAVAQGALRGSLVQRTNSFEVTGVGISPSFSFSHRVVSNNFQIVAHLKDLPTTNSGMWAGLMARSTTNDGDPFAALTAGLNNLNAFAGYDNGAQRFISTSNDPLATWKRLVREGTILTGWESRDGSAWTKVGSHTLSLSNAVLAGFAVASGNPLRYATAEFDNYETTSIRLLPPVYDPNAPVPQNVGLDVSVSSYGAPIRRVNYYSDGHLIGYRTAAPWSLTWTNAMAGTHQLLAGVVDALGLSVASDPFTITLQPAPSSAIYRTESPLVDSHWNSLFGASGYALPLSQTNFPAGAQFIVQGAGFGNWPGAWPALDNPSGGLIASAWYASDSSYTFRPPFENPYSITILLGDYLGQSPKVQLTVSSALDGAVLDQRIEENLGAGRYVSWVVRGPIFIRVQALSSSPAYIGGVFIDPIERGSIVLTEPNDGDVYVIPTSITLQPELSAKDLPVQAVAFYDGSTLIGKATAPPFQFQWASPLAGDHTLLAVAIGAYGPQATSAPVSIHCEFPTAEAVFSGIDSGTRGDWMNSYGHDGFGLAGGPMKQGPAARITLTDQVYAWASDFSGVNPLGLRLLGAQHHLTTYWNAPDNLTFNVDLLDGLQHLVALYIVNFSGGTIPQSIRVQDAVSGADLDLQQTDPLADGGYFIWNARGSLRFILSRGAATPWTPPALSGIFVGGPIPSSYDWWANHFGDPYSATPDWSADPDGDGRSNLMEYAMGTDPLTPDDPVAITTGYDGQYLYVSANATHVPYDVRLSLEQSADLVSWDSSLSATSTENPDSYNFVVLREGVGAKFFRLRVEFTQPEH